MRRIRKYVVAAAAVALPVVASAPAAHAAPVPPFTNAEVVTAPADLRPGALESSTTVRVVNEAQFRLTASLATWTMSNGVQVPGPTLLKDACIQSHLLHFDPVGTATPRVTGLANFSQPVVGVLPFNLLAALGVGELDSTDGPSGVPLGLPGTIYSAKGSIARGLDITIANRDSLSVNGTTVNFSMGGDAFDEVRVLTLCDPQPVVPEVPWSVTLPLSAVALLGGAVLIRRRAARPAAA